MARKTAAAEDRATKLARVKSLVSQGQSLADALTTTGISSRTFSRWQAAVATKKSEQPQSSPGPVSKRSRRSARASSNAGPGEDVALVSTISEEVGPKLAEAAPTSVE